VKKHIKNIIKGKSKIIIGLYIVIAILILIVPISVIISNNKYSETEAGYIVRKTAENSFHYIIDDNGSANPEFYDEFYYTIFVDDNYIKIKLPYNVYTSYQLGDHLTVYRKHNDILKKYWGYDIEIYDIHVPAVIVNDDYE
jgi:hypothetical protein